MQDVTQFLAVCGVIGTIALFLLQFVLGLAVGADARIRREHGKPVAFVGPGVWFFATLLGGFLTLALYWVMHYSSLRHAEEFPSRS